MSAPFADLGPTTNEVRAEVQTEWQRLLDSNAWVGGEAVERFEQQWAQYCGTSHAVGVANGTDALHLVLRALGIGAGDEVLVPANTFIATVEAVVLAGARPRFVDVDPETLLITPEAAAAAVTPATAAIIPVHLYGHVADLAGLAGVARGRGLALVEDAAQAHGASRDGARAGSVGVAAGFSFYPGKNLGAFGDAGAVVTSDAELAARIRSLGNHGRSDLDRYHHVLMGTNSRLDALQAVVLSAKLPRLDAWTERRRKVVALYRERLADLPLRLVEPAPGVESAWHLLVARVADRDRVRTELAQLGVQTGIHYPVPCHRQPAFAVWGEGTFPVADRAAAEIMSLPLHSHMGVEEIDVVGETLTAVLAPRAAVGVAAPRTGPDAGAEADPAPAPAVGEPDGGATAEEPGAPTPGAEADAAATPMAGTTTTDSPGRPPAPGPDAPPGQAAVPGAATVAGPLAVPGARRPLVRWAATHDPRSRLRQVGSGVRQHVRGLPDRTRLALLCAAVLLVSTLGSALVSALQPPTWSAEVDLLHEPGEAASIETAEREMITHQVLLTRRPLLEEAGDAVGRDPAELRDDVSVELMAGSGVMQLRVADRDADRATETARYLVGNYLTSADQLPGAADIGVLRVLGEPSLADEPVGPQPLRAATAGLLLGAVLVVALLALLRARERRGRHPAP